MKVFLVRHGEAVPEEEAGSDRDRWLAPRGREAVRVLARLLRSANVEPDAIVSSPLPRAVQTAELLAQGLDYLLDIRALRALEPSAQPGVAAQAIAIAGEAVIVVGHEPSLSALGAHLLGVPAFPSFRTAQCCAIEHGKPTFMARADLDNVLPFFIDG
ncbi:MAG TPA: phosphoglycerate mutase family protein [Kofleriaceae bacterium]|nr:phosphoglycerate mutase family protein [Kofleriaceae bacterium]